MFFELCGTVQSARPERTDYTALRTAASTVTTAVTKPRAAARANRDSRLLLVLKVHSCRQRNSVCTDEVMMYEELSNIVLCKACSLLCRYTFHAKCMYA